jgi:hypothetical protein
MASDLTGSLLAASVTIMSIATVLVALRLWIRSHMKVLGLDDHLITGSWVCLMALCIVVIMSSQVGFGKHRDDVPDSDYEAWLRFTTACSATYSIGVPLAKMSFAVLYIRIQPNRMLQTLNKVLIVFLACQGIEETLIVILKCKPIIASYRLDVVGKCLDLRVLWWSTFIFNLVTDLFLFVQPIPAMWKLQLPLAKRIGLICMLSLGLLVCVTSVIRIVYVTRIGPDDTYEFAEPMIWSEVELAALIVCSCIPSLRQVVQKIPWLNHAFGLSSNKTSQTPYGQSGGRKQGSIPLQSYSHRDYTRSQNKSSAAYHNHAYGMTSRAVAGNHSKNDSTEEIFPHKTDGHGAIMVTHEVTRDVESTASSTNDEIKPSDASNIPQVR